MVAIMGTSICHMVLGERTGTVEGKCGVVVDGIVPGLFGFEAGQSVERLASGQEPQLDVTPIDHRSTSLLAGVHGPNARISAGGRRESKPR